MKLHTVSFGCQANVADSQEMSRALSARGFQYTESLDNADALIINTCTVRQHAEDKAFSFVGTLRKWKEQNPNRLLIVAGCAAERTKDTLRKRFPFVDLVVGAKSIEEFPAIIDELLRERFDWNKENRALWLEESLNEIASPRPKGGARNDSTTAYVTIMRGCNYTCTYCIVPAVRGREIYRPPETILAEIGNAVRSGAKEIMLLGQTVNSYKYVEKNPSPLPSPTGRGKKGGSEGDLGGNWNFAKLLKRIAEIKGVERIRFMSPHPYYFTDELIETIASVPQIARRIHLPVQSGSNRVLKLMRRNYTREKYLEIVKNLKSRISDLEITTDFIVGFPTETERDFQDSLDLIEDVGFDGAYCFKFSAREGTEAALMEGQWPTLTKEQRLARILEKVKTISVEKKKLYGRLLIER